MVGYNLTEIATNSTGIVSLAQTTNEVLMFGTLGIMLLVAVFIIAYSSFYFATKDAKKAITASCFVCFGLSLSLTALNLVDGIVLYVCLILSAASLAFTWKTE